MPQQNVVFRRINGHIVPIKKAGTPSGGSSGKRQVKDVAQGAALTGAGVLAGVYSGKFAAKSVLASAYAENVGRDAARKARSIFQYAKKSAILANQKSIGLNTQAAFGLEKVGDYAFKKGQKETAMNASKIALGSATISERLFRNRKVIRGFGTAIGSGLIVAGLKKLYEGITGEKSSTKYDVIAGAAGASAALAVRAGYVKDLNKFKNSGAFSHAIKVALKGLRLAK